MEWKVYPKNENYLVSDTGLIKSVRYNKLLIPKKTWDGYLRIQIWNHNKSHFISWHRVVAETWIPNPENKPFVNHKDCNRSNNCFANLEWCTQKENINYSQKINSSYNDRIKEVQQFDKNNKLLATYKSISDASRITGIKVSSISYSANGQRKTGGGYIWRFV